MTLSRTVPHHSSVADLAVAALSAQGRYGQMTQIARDNGIRRQTLYDLRDQAHAALNEQFSPQPVAVDPADLLCVARPDIRRAIWV